MRAYGDADKIADKAPAVVVVHENRGLNPIEDVARRVASGVHRAGAGWPERRRRLSGNDDEGRALQQKVDPVKLMNDFCGGRVYGELSTGDGKVGITGFATAAASQRGGGGDPGAGLRGAVYGRQPPLKEVDKIKAPLLLHYAGLDSGVKAGLPMNRR